MVTDYRNRLYSNFSGMESHHMPLTIQIYKRKNRKRIGIHIRCCSDQLWSTFLYNGVGTSPMTRGHNETPVGHNFRYGEYLTKFGELISYSSTPDVYSYLLPSNAFLSAINEKSTSDSMMKEKLYRTCFGDICTSWE
jgi:hypothetical protein